MAAFVCPLCRSANIVVIELANDMRVVHIRCSTCGRDSHVPYPPR